MSETGVHPVEAGNAIDIDGEERNHPQHIIFHRDEEAVQEGKGRYQDDNGDGDGQVEAAAISGRRRRPKASIAE